MRTRREQTLAKVEEFTDSVATKKNERRDLIAAVSRAKSELATCQLAEEKAEGEQDRLFAASRDGDRLLEKAKELEELVKERAEAITRGSSGKKLHDEREGQIRLIRQQNEGAGRRLSQLFDVVIRELVPGEIEESVLIDGKGITLKVSQGGERSTAAIESLKVVAFDIAVLILALEGAVSLSTFLLHDSPREADLGQSIYDRLFRFIQSLEDEAHFTNECDTVSLSHQGLHLGVMGGMRILLDFAPCISKKLEQPFVCLWVTFWVVEDGEIVLQIRSLQSGFPRKGSSRRRHTTSRLRHSSSMCKSGCWSGSVTIAASTVPLVISSASCTVSP